MMAKHKFNGWMNDDMNVLRSLSCIVWKKGYMIDVILHKMMV